MYDSDTISTRSERLDAISVLFGGVCVAVIACILIGLRTVDTFRPDGIAWTIETDEQTIDATVDSGAGSIDGIVSSVTVIAPNVDGGSVAAIIASLALLTLAVLLVISCAMHIAWSFLRGRFFIEGTARSFEVAGGTIVFAPCLLLSLDTAGRNGVLQALDIVGGEPVHPTAAWALLPYIAIGLSVILIGTAFRRGIRLQRETEGLV
jgi:hypothetical protein